MADQYISALSTTWNSSGTTYNAIKYNVTDSASASDSALVNLQIGGTSMFRVQKDGEISTAHYYSAIQKWGKGSDIASASALTVPSDGNFFDVTGTTTVTSISAVQVGTRILLQFDGILTLTHHATDLILPGGASITTAAGDFAEFVEYASGDWALINYTTASATYLANVVEDTTPQLGGNLDLNGNGITFPGATVTDVTGADTTVVSGTAGTSGNLAMWDANGDAVDASVVAANVLVSGDIGSSVQGYDAGLASIAGLTTAADRMIYTTGSDTYAVATLTSAARSILDDASVSAMRTTLGLAIGSDVQAYDADIPTVAASQAEMEAGTETALRSMTPQRVAQAIAALAGGGGGLNSVQVFTASGTWTRPSGVTKVLMFVTGAGGGGQAGAAGSHSGAGGEAGGTAIKFLDVSSIASSTITIGAGGSGGTGSGGDGVDGGDSSWADGTNTITGAGGDRGDDGGISQGIGGSGEGTATNGDLNIPGGDGADGLAGTGTAVGGNGGASFWGGGGKGSYTGNINAENADAYGAGGGGGGSSSSLDGNGGAGKAGVVFVLEFA